MPVRVRNSIGTDLGVWGIKLPILRSGNVNDAVNNGVHDVNAFGAKLSCQALGQRSHGKLASGEAREQRTSTHCRRC